MNNSARATVGITTSHRVRRDKDLPYRVFPLKRLELAMLLLLSLQTDFALSNPSSEKLVTGTATFQRSPNVLTINQTSDRAIINWQGFSIGASELTRFIQPTALSAVLNRVVSGNPSALLGKLGANGKVFLINPNGVLVGNGAVINTNSFVASTLDVHDSNFLAGGDLNFSGSSSAGIQNLGKIHALNGDVFLIAHSVSNAGVIEASKGVVGLAASNDVVLKKSGDERLFIQASLGTASTAETGVNNAGLISAVQAELRGAGGNVYGLAVNNTGMVQVTGITEKDGRVLLTSTAGNLHNSGNLLARNANGDGATVQLAAGHDLQGLFSATNSGVIDASGKSSGTKGGLVIVTGDKVSLSGTALIDASGDRGGGTVLIGGDYQGANAAIGNAYQTLVGKDSRISADAVTSGNGGKVIVWANHSTEFDGYISARGGASGGDGGLVETSAKILQIATGARVDAGASVGLVGHWLLDPLDVTVVNSFTGTTNGGFNSGTPNVFTPTGNSSTVNAGTISSALTNGTSVTITTGGAAVGSQLGNIQVNSNIFANSTTALPTLTLNADNQVVINAAIQGNPGSKGFNLVVNANDAINFTSQANLFLVRNGTLTAGIKNPAQASSGGIAINGTLTGNTADNSATDKIVLQAAGDITGTGSLGTANADLNSSAGSINYGGRLTANLLTAAAPAGSVTISNSSGVNINFLGAVNSGGAINIKNTGNGGSPLNIVGAVVATGINPLNVTTVGTLFIDSNGALGKGTGSLNNPTGTITLNARDVSDSASPVTPSISAVALAISAQQGIGSGSSNPLDISIANLEALTPAGGIFLKNSGKDLTIGGIASSVQGGVLTGLTNGSEIQIVNDRGIFLTVAGIEKAHVAGPQNILIQANGTTADIVIGDSSLNAVNAHSGNVTLNAGRDIVIGKSGLFGNVSGSTVNLNAGHAVVLDEGSIVTGTSGINATAGTVVPATDGRLNSIVFYQTAVAGTRLVTNGAPINLTTAPGGFVDAHSGPGIAASSAGGVINFRTDDVFLSSPVDAGTGYVQFLPASVSRSIDIGSKTTGKLSLTNAELGLVRAGTVVIGNAAQRTDVSVTAPINITTFGALGLQALGTAGNGNMIAAALTVPFLEIQATNSITSSSAINVANKLTLSSDNDRVILSGPVKTGGLVMNAAGTINVDSLANQISELGDIKRGGQLTIRNTVPLSIRGSIAGTNTANDVTIRTVGDITMNGPGASGFSGAHVVVSGARNEAVLEAGNGRFINNAGAVALDPQSGARFRVYSMDNGPPFNTGGLPGDVVSSAPVGFPNDPNSPASAFYFASLVSTGTSGGLVTPPVTQIPATNILNSTTASSQIKGVDTTFDGQSIDVIIRPPTEYRQLATLTVTPDVTPDPLSQEEHNLENLGNFAMQPSDGNQIGAILKTAKNATYDNFHLDWYQDMFLRYRNTPWRLVATDGGALAEAEPGTVLATANTNIGTGFLTMFWTFGQTVQLPPGGSVRVLKNDDFFSSRFYPNVMAIYDADGNLARDAFGNLLDTGTGNLVSVGSGNNVGSLPVMKTVAANRLDVEKAETFAKGKSVVLSNGQRVVVPGGSFTAPPRSLADLGYGSANSMSLDTGSPGLGQPLTGDQAGNIANIIAVGGGNLTTDDVADIVAAGGGNFTPGVVAAIIAAGGGNLGSTSISNIIAAGGGNLANSTAMTSIISASIIAAGGGNIIAAGGGNIIAAGGGNLNSSIANIIAAGGGNIGTSDVAQIIAAGGGNIIAAGGGNIIAAGGGNIIAAGGGNIIAAGGGNLLSLAASIIATGGGNVSAGRASEIIAAGGGNFYNTVNALIAAGGGNVISPNGSNIISQGGGNVISPNGSNLISQGGGNVISPNGSNLISQDGAGLISPNSSDLISKNGAGVISPNSSNFINSLSSGSSFIRN